jgi:DNA-directed RNA polymerase specialized sigma24 family protein
MCAECVTHRDEAARNEQSPSYREGLSRHRGEGEVSPDELASVIARYYCAALAHAAPFAGYGAAAEDIVQEAALRCWLARPRLDGARSVGGYFLKVVQKCGVDWARRTHEFSVDPVVLGALEALVRTDGGLPPIDDVSLSDFVGDTGSPLQWAMAWESVGAREQVERSRAERAQARAMPLRVSIGAILEAHR